MITLAMTFSVRVDILSALGAEFDLSHYQQGLIITAVSWSYPVAIFVIGPLCDALGMGRLMILACACHVLGILLTIASPGFGFPVLLFATILIGLGDGIAEAVFNPLVTTMYPDEKTGKIGLLHSFWPAGLIIGGVLCLMISPFFHLSVPGVSAAAVSLSWKVKMATVLIPALAYGVLMFGQKFPQTERAASGVSTGDMFREALRPGFLILLSCMVFTAVTEVGPDQWIGSVMTDTVGIRGIWFLIYTAGIMFVMRVYAAQLVRLLTPFGLLMLSCVSATAGLYWMSYSFTPLVALVAATFFGAGKACLWPTLIGVTSERYPRGGAFLLALLGGTGMIVGGLAGPVMGRIYDTYTINALPAHVARVVVVDGRYSPVARERLIESEKDSAKPGPVTGVAKGNAGPASPAKPASLATEALANAEKQGAAMTFRYAALTPILPFFAYIGLALYHRSRGGYRTVALGPPKRRRRGDRMKSS